ncbi:MAG: hypothetical protein FWD79_12500 [Desulfobulbus sp.]|nr:hypothetical protein [Desulfobulbus sp.]
MNDPISQRKPDPSHLNSARKTVPEGVEEHHEVSVLIQKNILDPLLTFAELVRVYDMRNGMKVDYTLSEIMDLLRLIVLGAYVEQEPYATLTGASLSGCGTAIYDREIGEWLEHAKVLAEQERINEQAKALDQQPGR